MREPTDEDAPDEEVLPALPEKDRDIASKLEDEHRAQQHDYFRKRNVWPRG